LAKFYLLILFIYLNCALIMKLIYLPFVLSLCLLAPAARAQDPIDNIVVMLKHGDVHGLTAMFAPTVEITMMDQEDTYSKRQAADVMTKFFAAHKPLRVSLLHKVNSNPKYIFGVAILTSADGTYRISYTLNETGSTMMIIELRIENGKN
jgi:hypothetical protein